MRLRLFDVTEQAREEAGGRMPWQVAVSRRVWDLCVVEPKEATEEQRKKRLGDLLMFMRHALHDLHRARRRRNELLARFEITTGYTYPSPGAAARAELSVVADIDRDGRPRLVVLFPEEIASSPWKLW